MTSRRKLVIRLIPLALVVIFGFLLLCEGVISSNVLGIFFGSVALIYAVVRLDVVFSQAWEKEAQKP